MDELISVLTESVKKHGPQPFTTQYLLNILKLAKRIKEDNNNKREELQDLLAEEAYFDSENFGDRE